MLSDDEEDEKRVVRSQKDKRYLILMHVYITWLSHLFRYDELKDIIKSMRNSQKIRDIVKLQTGNIPSPKKYQMHFESKHTEPFCLKYPTSPISNAYRTLLPQVPNPTHIKCIQNPFASSTQPHPYQMHTEPFCLKYLTPPISNAYRTLLPQVPNPTHIKCIQNPFASST